MTAHVFGEDAIPGLLAAGIDCLEHGTGLTDDTIAEMARRGVHLVPTLINVANFPASPTPPTAFPAYAKHMRDLHARSDATIAAARRRRGARCTPAPTPAGSSTTAGSSTRCWS